MNETNPNFPWQLERGTARIFEPQQQAEILSWFGREDIPRQQKEDFLQALITFEEGCGGFYGYRAYFLAAEALSRFPDSQFGDEIVARLLGWSYAYFQPYPHWKKYPVPLVLAAQNILERTDRRRVIAAFEDRVRAVEDRWMLCKIARRLGQFDPGNATAIAALVGLIEVERKPEIVLEAARGLIKIAPQHPITLSTLIDLYQQNPTSYCLLTEVAQALYAIELGVEEVIELFLLFAQQSLKEFPELDLSTEEAVFPSPSSEIEGLRQVACGNRKEIDTLLRLTIAASEIPATHSIIYYEILPFIKKNAIANKAAISVLTQLLDKAELSQYHIEYAKTLMAIDPDNEKAISIFSSFLNSYPNDDVTDESISGYERLCRFETSYYNRCAAAEALARIEAYREAAVATLQELVSAFNYRFSVSPALIALASLDPTKELAIETVLQALESPIDFIGYGSNVEFDLTIEKMSQWVAASSNPLLRQKAIATLTSFIEQTTARPESPERKRQIKTVALALGRIEPKNPLALSIILPTIEADKEVESQDRSFWFGEEDEVENKYRHFRFSYQDLATIGAIDRVSVAQILETFQLDEPEEEKRTCLMYVAGTFEQHIEQIPESSLAQWVRALKPYLGETHYRNPYSGYDACYRIIWNCARAMSYPAFYEAWNGATYTNLI